MLLLLAFAAQGCSAQITTIPSCIRSIEEEAFAGDSSIGSLIIPESVEEIGSLAFADCTNIDKIRLDNNEISLALEALGRKSENRILYATPCASLDAYLSAHPNVRYPYQDSFRKLIELAETRLGHSYAEHDCITFVRLCYKNALGITIPASCTSAERDMKSYVSGAVRISRSDIANKLGKDPAKLTAADIIPFFQPGDILCWSNDSVNYCTHVGMYVGAGKWSGTNYSSGIFIESSRSAYKVQYNYVGKDDRGNFRGYYVRNFICAWRIL